MSDDLTVDGFRVTWRALHVAYSWPRVNRPWHLIRRRHSAHGWSLFPGDIAVCGVDMYRKSRSDYSEAKTPPEGEKVCPKCRRDALSNG